MYFDENASNILRATQPPLTLPPKQYMNAFVNRVSSEIQIAGASGKVLIVGVSGGPDSVALITSLTSLKESLNLKLYVAHVDHSLRTNSKIDKAFVSELAKQLQLPYSTKRVNVISFASRHRLSIEQAARELRYKFFADLVREKNAGAIVLGHTKDDQAETILLHIVRGAGLRGLAGMTLSSYMDQSDRCIEIIRPLLSIERSETQAFCKFIRVLPRYDETNTNQTNPRNYVRLGLLPELTKLNPRAKSAILRLGEIAARDLDYIDSNVNQIWNQVVSSTPEFIKINRLELLKHHPSMQFHLLRRAYNYFLEKGKSLEARHLDSMVNAMTKGTPKFMELPNKIYFHLNGEVASMGGNSNLIRLPRIQGSHPISTLGETVVPYSNQEQLTTDNCLVWRFQANLIDGPATLEPNPLIAQLDYEKLGSSSIIRSRLPGDHFSPLGANNRAKDTKKSQTTPGIINNKRYHQKKLQDFFINSKIPVGIRDSIPLVVSDTGIAWVVGWRIAEWARVTPKTKHTLRLQGYPPLDGLTKSSS